MPVRTITTRLAIDGESQYRQSITNINSQLKALKSELALVTSQYQTNANSMEALRAKGEALANNYTAQKNKVDTLKAALDNAKTAQQTYAAQMDEYKSKLAAAEKALDELGDATEENAAEHDRLTAEIEELNSALADTTARHEAATKGVNNWQTQLNYAERDLNNLDAEIAQNNQYLTEAEASADGCATSIDQYGKVVRDAGDASEDFGDASTNAVESLSQALVAAGLADKVKDVAAALYDCVDTFAAFESQMSTVQAISGATAEDMVLLTDKAKYMGATTSFTATQAGQALEYMAMAGWKTEDMLGGLEGIMYLAAASGEDLATTSDIVTDALTAFGLAASDSAHFADVLAIASSNSNTNVGMMGETFKYAAPVAGALGYSIEDTALAIGLMANAGIKGSQSGTALRGMLTNLAKPSDTVAKYMDDLGISLTNADGSMKTLSELLVTLRSRFVHLAGAQRAEYAAGIAGKEAMSGLLAIVSASDADFQKLTAAINDCNGAAYNMSQIRLDNYAGQITLLESAVDGLKLELGGQLAPMLERITAGATSVASGMTELLQECPALSAVIAGLTASTGLLVTAFAGFSILQTITPALAAFNAVLTANPAGVAAVAIAGVVTALATLAAYCSDASDGVGGLNGKLRESEKTYRETADQTLATATAAEALIDKLAALESQESMTKGETALYAKTVDELRALMPELNIKIDEQTGLLIGGAEALRVNTEAWKENALAQAMQERYQTVLSGQADALVTAAERQIAYNDALATCTDLERQLNELSEEMRRIDSDSAMSAEEKATRMAELSQQINILTDQYVAAQDSLSDYDSQLQQAQESVASYDEEIERLIETEDALCGANGEAADSTTDFQTRIESIVSAMETLEGEYLEAAQKAQESIKEQFGLWEDLDEVTAVSVDSIIESMQKQEEYWNDYSDNLDNLMSRNIDDLDALVLSIADGSSESAAAIAGMAQATNEELRAMMQKYDELGEAEDRAAGDIADLQSGYSRSMEVMGKAAADAVKQMDVSSDAKRSGENSIQGYINGVKNKTGALFSAMRRAANDAWESFRKALDEHSPSRKFYSSGENSIEGYENAIEDRTAGLKRTMAETAMAAVESFQTAAAIDVSEVNAKIMQANARFYQDDAAPLPQVPRTAAQTALEGAPIQIYGNTFIIREEQDIDRVAEELHAKYRREMRGRGGVS